MISHIFALRLKNLLQLHHNYVADQLHMPNGTNGMIQYVMITTILCVGLIKGKKVCPLSITVNVIVKILYVILANSYQ